MHHEYAVALHPVGQNCGLWASCQVKKSGTGEKNCGARGWPRTVGHNPLNFTESGGNAGRLIILRVESLLELLLLRSSTSVAAATGAGDGIGPATMSCVLASYSLKRGGFFR